MDKGKQDRTSHVLLEYMIVSNFSYLFLLYFLEQDHGQEGARDPAQGRGRRGSLAARSLLCTGTNHLQALSILHPFNIKQCKVGTHMLSFILHHRLPFSFSHSFSGMVSYNIILIHSHQGVC